MMVVMFVLFMLLMFLAPFRLLSMMMVMAAVRADFIVVMETPVAVGRAARL